MWDQRELAAFLDSPARGHWRMYDPLLRQYMAQLPGR